MGKTGDSTYLCRSCLLSCLTGCNEFDSFPRALCLAIMGSLHPALSPAECQRGWQPWSRFLYPLLSPACLCLCLGLQTHFNQFLLRSSISP